MSHDLDESTGKPAMAYVGERPWHGLGEALPPDQDIETWVQAARLDWEIEMIPVSYQMGGRNHVMGDRFVLARSDTQAALSVVSRDYQVVQPKEVLEFYRDLVEERHYKLETAGALDLGRKVPGAHARAVHDVRCQHGCGGVVSAVQRRWERVDCGVYGAHGPGPQQQATERRTGRRESTRPSA